MSAPSQEACALPHLAEIFSALTRGQHLCRENGKLYQALQEQEAEYEHLFHCLGYRLVADERGFYYFHAGEGQNVSPQTRRSALFFFVLVEDLWAEEGGTADLEDLVMERVWTIADLPHLKRQRYLELMGMLEEEPDESLLRQEVGRLERFGFAIQTGADRFRFRPPALRFLDLARVVVSTMEDKSGEREEQA